ncbi:hypothetical protein BHE97_01480 [Aeromicrobium sp. PE09-221]|nr:hypothetical protein BHE97_01480 [Aeromicrobium sp. PE09-221]
MPVPRHGRARVVAATVLAIGLATSACSAPNSSASDEPREASDPQVQVVNWGVSAAPRSLDPAGGYDGASLLVNGQLLEGLTQVSADGTVEPRLAESWSEEATSIVLTLREGVTFWDGSPLTADDVVFSLSRYADAGAGSELAGSLTKVAGVRETGDLEVTLDLASPDPQLLSILGVMGIMSRAHAEAAGANLGTPDGLVMGTGPFEVQSYSPSTGVKTVRNDDYWGPAPTVQALNFEVVTDPDSLRLAIENGDIDGTFDVPIQNATTWDRSGDIHMTYADAPQNTILPLDTSRPPFDDVHARRAMAYLADREGLVESLFAGHGLVTDRSIVHPGLWTGLLDDGEIDDLYESLPSYAFDVEKAREELAKSATPDGFELDVVYATSASHLGSALQSIAQSAEEIGITINVVGVPYAEYFEKLRAKANPLAVVTVGADAPLPTTILETVVAPLDQDGNLNFANYDSPEMTDALVAFAAGQDTERVDAARTAVELLSEDMPYVPLFATDRPMALGAEVVYADADFSYWSGPFSCWSCRLKAAAE